MSLRITKLCKCGCEKPVKRWSMDWLPQHRTPMHRFWMHVEKRGFDECWFWRGSTNGKGSWSGKGYGHGRFMYKGRLQMATHFLYEVVLNESIPNGMFVLHTCDNPGCVNPDHLYLGTQSQNMLDMYKRGRVKRFGEYHPSAKLSNKEVSQLREVYWPVYKNLKKIEKKNLMDQLVKKFKLCRMSIHNIFVRHTWTHI